MIKKFCLKQNLRKCQRPARKCNVHAAVTWLLYFMNLDEQTARCIQRLQEYNFTSEHRQGRKHNNADALARRPCPEECSHCQKFEQ
jgi:hypothetical protein